jgi:hypothetical protein
MLAKSDRVIRILTLTATTTTQATTTTPQQKVQTDAKFRIVTRRQLPLAAFIQVHSEVSAIKQHFIFKTCKMAEMDFYNRCSSQRKSFSFFPTIHPFSRIYIDRHPKVNFHLKG